MYTLLVAVRMSAARMSAARMSVARMSAARMGGRVVRKIAGGGARYGGRVPV